MRVSDALGQRTVLRGRVRQEIDGSSLSVLIRAGTSFAPFVVLWEIPFPTIIRIVRHLNRKGERDR